MGSLFRSASACWAALCCCCSAAAAASSAAFSRCCSSDLRSDKAPRRSLSFSTAAICATSSEKSTGQRQHTVHPSASTSRSCADDGYSPSASHTSSHSRAPEGAHPDPSATVNVPKKARPSSSASFGPGPSLAWSTGGSPPPTGPTGRRMNRTWHPSGWAALPWASSSCTAALRTRSRCFSAATLVTTRRSGKLFACTVAVTGAPGSTCSCTAVLRNWACLPRVARSSSRGSVYSAVRVHAPAVVNSGVAKA